jgi:sugar lactone lactonase YvrE
MKPNQPRTIDLLGLKYVVLLGLLSIHSAQGQIYVTNNGGTSINEYNPDGTPAGSEPLISGLSGAGSLAVSGAYLFVATGSGVAEYTTSGTLVNASLISGLNGVNGLAVSGSNLYVTNSGTGKIGEYTLGATPGTVTSSIPSLITGLSEPSGIAVSGSDLFIALDSSDSIAEYTTSGTLVSAFSLPTENDPEDLAIIGSNLFVDDTTDGGGAIGEYTTTGSTINEALVPFLGFSANPSGAAALGSNLLVVEQFDANSGAGTVGEYNSSGTVNATFITGLTNPSGIAVANQLSQTISFPTIPSQAYPGPTIALGATTSAGLPVSYSVVSGPATVSGATLTLTGTGRVTVQASQAGNASYQPAASVNQSFLVVPPPTGLVTSTSNGQVSIIGYTGSDAVLVIPATIDGLPVTIIGSDAFENDTSFTSVTIPTTVFDIGASAFQGCASLTSVTIPDSVTNMGESAFFGCSALTSVSIGHGLSSITVNAFGECTSLTGVTIPDTITGIQNVAFAYDSALTSVTIPPSVSALGSQVFYDCPHLTSATFLGNAPITGTSDFGLSAGSFSVSYYNGASGFTSPSWTDGAGDTLPAVDLGNNDTVPVITSPATAAGQYGVALNFAVQDTVVSATFSETGLPTGLTINPSSGLISGSPSQSGTFYVILSATNPNNGAIGNVTLTLTINQVPQTITFPAISSAQFPGPSVPLAATTSTAMPVTYSVVSGPGTISGSTLIPTGEGTVVVAANQPGNANYAAAAQVTINVTVASPFYTFFTLAGTAGESGSNNATGPAAEFGNPGSVALDENGNIYVADTANSIIRKITPAGVVTTFAGTPGNVGSSDGLGSAASFNHPAGLALDTAGNLYVADTGNDTIREINSGGNVTTLAGTVGVPGSASGNINGNPSAASFSSPKGIAWSDETIYIADGNNFIRAITYYAHHGGYIITTLAGVAGSTGSSDGIGAAAQFDNPTSLAFDSNDNLYVADSGNNTIREITPRGGVTTLAGTAGVTGYADGAGVTAQFNSPTGIAVDGSGNVYVADQGNDLVRKITSAGVTTTAAGLPGTTGPYNGAGTQVRFNSPAGIAVDGNGSLYVADRGNDTIRKGLPEITLSSLAASPLVTVNQSVALNDQDSSGANLYYIVVSGSAVISGVDFNLLTFTGVGNVVVEIVSPTDPRLTAGGAAAPSPNQPVSSMVGTMQSAVVQPANQTIDAFTPIPDQVYGVPFTVTPPAATSGLPVALTLLSGPATLSGNVVTCTGAGTIVLAANQPGDANYNAAPLVVASVSVYYPSYTFTTLAGAAPSAGSTNGSAIPTARFSFPTEAASDNQGNIYVADEANDTIRKITPAGVVTTLAGTAGTVGSTNGTGSAALFNAPSGLRVDGSGNIYVADTGNNLIRMITPLGVVTTLAGTVVEGSANGNVSGGNPGAASFDAPEDVAVDGNGNVYVADSGNNEIREITSAGVVTTLAGTTTEQGLENGNVSGGNPGAAVFSNPSGVAVDGNGNVYVADTTNSVIREISSAGLVTTLAGTAGMAGSNNGNVSGGNPGAASFSFPTGVAVDASGDVYVADTDNNLIRKISSAGVVTTLAGQAGATGSANGALAVSLFNNPTGLALDANGNVYVADAGNDVIREVAVAGSVTTFAGVAGNPGSSDTVGTSALFDAPAGIAVDGSGNTYVADRVNDLIRKISHAGVVTTLAGTAGVPGSRNGTGPAAQFNNPRGCATDKNGNIYIADTGNSIIREITPAGLVTTVAGTAGVTGAANGTGSAALFNRPTALAVDDNFNLYVADSGNDTIRKITSGGVVSTLAGSAGTASFANGNGTAALFNNPSGIAVDTNDNVYVGDTGNDLVREISSAGMVTTVAGSAGVAGSTDGLPSVGLLNSPQGVAVDGNGNVFVADSVNDTIRKITPSGVLATIAGTAGKIGSADGDGPQVVFNSPVGVAVDRNGYLYVADTGNNTIRQGIQDTSLNNLLNFDSFIANERISLYSGLGFFISSGPATLSGVDLNIVTFTGGGTVVVSIYTPNPYEGKEGPSVPGSTGIQSSQPLMVQASSVFAISLAAPAAATAGTSIQFTVTPEDQYTDPITGSTDTFEFTSSDDMAIVPAPSTLANGTGSFSVTFGSGGNQTITVIDLNTGTQITSSAIPVTVAPVTYSQWVANNNVVGAASSTPEGDSVANLLKYLCDIKPVGSMAASDRAALPVFRVVTNGNSTDLTLTYRQSASASGLLVDVQTSTDLVTWTTLNSGQYTTQQMGTVLGFSDIGDPIIQVEVNTSGATREFIRLSVSSP